MKWRVIIGDLKIFKFVVSILNKFKILPAYLPILSKVLNASQTLMEKWINYVVTSNQKTSEVIIKKEEEITKVVTAEVAKPLPQQNNDVLRDQLRNRHK
jgi:hypothetical protein